MKYNPADLHLLVNPYPTYRRFRSISPISEGISPLAQYNKFWYVFGFDEALEIIRSSSPLQERGTIQYGDNDSDQFWQKISHWLLFLNEEEHKVNRDKISESFRLTSVQGITGYIQQKSDEIAKNITYKNQFDLMNDYVYPLSISTTCHLLGISEIATKWLKPRSSAVSKVLAFSHTENDYRVAINAVEDIRDLLLSEIKKPRKMGLLSNLEANSINIEEHLDLLIQILFAGPETSSDATGSCLNMIWSRHEILQLLGKQPDLITQTVRECLRYDTSVQYSTVRKMQSEIQIGNQSLEIGDALMINFGACNRDPRRYINPDDFDIFRSTNGPDLSFGHGPHYCIGVHLARAQISIAIKTMLNYLGNDWEISDCVLRDNHIFRGPKKLVVKKIKSRI